MSAWHTYDLYSNDDGTIEGESTTNDDNDDGYSDGTIEQWHVKFANREEMLKRTGGSHYGCSGIKVQVYLDGREVKR